MEIKQSIFDNGVNINGKLCAFKIETYRTRHKLDGMYGVSGAERSKEDEYIETTTSNVLGYFNEETGSIKSINVYGSEYDLKSNYMKIIGVKIIDQEKLLKEIVF